ncbi:MAG: 50S ribosomal protein L4, partial [Nanoarchaeota archaeon]|nr:50S ribosomal protein L4 [Nanoarchaeota archaeon]
SGYGRGMSRIPRKALSRKGSQFNWVGAEVSSTRGGRRAHPPKTISMVNTLKINKKEMERALNSALSATASKREIVRRYESVTEKDITNVPFIVETKLVSLKTRDMISSLKKVLGEELFAKVSRKRKIRPGKGRLRGRKHKTTAGFLLVTGKEEKIKANVMESKSADKVGIIDLANGGLGRLTVYTENAIKELGERIK